MASDDPGYSVEPRWKEEVVYREGDQSIVFDAAWGRTPHVLYVPSEWAWDLSTPAWLHGRRAEVVDRLERESQHVIASDDLLDVRLRERLALRGAWTVRVEIERLDAHPGDVEGRQTQADVDSALMLSDLVATVVEPFLERAPGATWWCRARIADQWRDVADVSTGGPVDQRGARLLAPDAQVGKLVGQEQVLAVACRPR